MMNTIAIIIIILSILQIGMGIQVLLGKFDPLLPSERKKLPAKARKKAQQLNAIAMFVTSAITCVLGVGLLLNSEIIMAASAILLVVAFIVMTILGFQAEGKYMVKNYQSMPHLKRLFYGLDMSWKHVIVSAIVLGVFVGLLMSVPALVDTSFTRIGVIFYWWVLFGTIIITNSKTHLDAALKCFVFFLISQPLIYLVQVPFSQLGWGLFGFYRYWFMWTLATLPMGFIGHWLLARKDIWSAIILGPAVALVAFEGVGEFNTAFNNFPQYFISGLYCLGIIIVLLLGVLGDWRQRIFSIISAVIFGIIMVLVLASRPEEMIYNLVYDMSSYGVTPAQEWRIDSDLTNEEAKLTEEEGYDEWGNPNGEHIYYLRIKVDANRYGTHDMSFTSGDVVKHCTLEITKKAHEFTCAE